VHPAAAPVGEPLHQLRRRAGQTRPGDVRLQVERVDVNLELSTGSNVSRNRATASVLRPA